jgi:hypothetical protein
MTKLGNETKRTNIDFKRSMGLDERNSKYAQTRVGFIDKIGLFPMAEIEVETLSNTFEPKVIVEGDGTWAFGEDVTDDLSVYDITTGSSLSESRVAGAAGSLEDAVFYNDGTGDYIYGIESNGSIFTFNTTTEVLTTGVHSTSGTGGGERVSYCDIDDRLYFYSDNQIFRLNGTTWEGSVKTLPSTYELKEMFPYKDKMVFIMSSNSTSQIKAFFWDRSASTFSSIVNIGNGFYVGSGVVSGKIAVAINKIEVYNSKENKGTIEYLFFNGGSFILKNSIKSVNHQTVTKTVKTHCDGESLYIPLTDESKYPAIYRFRSDYSISGMTQFGTEVDNVYSVSTNSGGLQMAYTDTSNVFKIGQIADNSGTDGDFGEQSIYISEMFGDPTVSKQMTDIVLSFTKTEVAFDNSELQLYYRLVDPYDIDDTTDEAASWILIGEYEYSVNGAKDRIVFSRTSTALPHFKEIQFKIVTKRGLNIINGYFNTKDNKTDVI